MKPYRVTVRPFDETMRKLRKQPPSVKHVSTIISEPTMVIGNGKIIAIYRPINFPTMELLRICKALKFPAETRESGIKTRTIHLGSSKRNSRRDNRCWQSRFMRNYPAAHKVFEEFAIHLSRYFKRHFKSAFIQQAKDIIRGVKKVLRAYRFLRTIFTSAVVNKDSALPYHFDAANSDGGISCMAIFKMNQTGGELILPQLDIGFACQDGYMLLFDGKAYLHGVAPIVPHATLKGYRYTIVYYCSDNMQLCLPPDEEDDHYLKHLETSSANKRNKIKNNEN